MRAGRAAHRRPKCAKPGKDLRTWAVQSNGACGSRAKPACGARPRCRRASNPSSSDSRSIRLKADARSALEDTVPHRAQAPGRDRSAQLTACGRRRARSTAATRPRPAPTRRDVHAMTASTAPTPPKTSRASLHASAHRRPTSDQQPTTPASPGELVDRGLARPTRLARWTCRPRISIPRLSRVGRSTASPRATTADHLRRRNSDQRRRRDRRRDRCQRRDRVDRRARSLASRRSRSKRPSRFPELFRGQVVRISDQPTSGGAVSITPAPVHPVTPAEHGYNLAKTVIKRSRVEPVARYAVTRLTRQTYSRTINLLPTRDELPFLLNARGLTGSGAEIGVAYGEFSEHILKYWRGSKLISIDPWIEMAPEEYVDTCNQDQDSMERCYEIARDRLSQFGDRSEIRRMTGHQAANDIPPHSLDFVYIDAQHSYEAVRSDIADWYPLIRPGGIIGGHDYNDGEFAQGTHGVRSAVDGFFREHRLPVAHTYADVPCNSWLVRVPG